MIIYVRQFRSFNADQSCLARADFKCDFADPFRIPLAYRDPFSGSLFNPLGTRNPKLPKIPKS